LARGKFEVLAGAIGTGKTTIAISFCATVTAGGKWPDGTAAEPGGSVLIWSGEDSCEDTLLPRFVASGGVPSRVYFIRSMVDRGRVDGRTRRPFDPRRDITPLIEAAKGIPDLRLMLIDPVVSAVAGDSHKNSEVRRGLQPLADFGEATNATVLGITYLSKNTTGNDPVDRVAGSLAFGAVPRVVMVTAKPLKQDQRRRLVRAKSNIGPDGGGFEYDLIQEPPPGWNFAAQRAVWRSPLEGTARDLLNQVELPEDDGRPAPRKTMASGFLQNVLAHGAMPTKQIEEAAEAAGISRATLRRAANELGIITDKSGYQGEWSWRMP
jgi:putative DNA primase/helicase